MTRTEARQGVRSWTPALGIAGVCLALLVGVGAVLGPRMYAAYQRQVTVPPTTALGDQCDEVPAGAERTTLTGEDGTVLGAAVVGPTDAEVGLVLRQGASQKICEWLPWAGDVAEQAGVRVLLFDRRGRGSTPGEENLSAEPADLGVAVARLRDDGASEVMLMASSMGNSIMFSALPDLSPPPCAVASVSPVLISGDANGTVDGSGLEDVPANTWVTWEGQSGGVTQAAESVIAAAEAAGQPGTQALEVDTHHHSRQLVLNHADVREFLLDAIASCSA